MKTPLSLLQQDQAANAVCCDRQSVSEQAATMLIFPDFPLFCVILLSSIDAIFSLSSCRESGHELWAIWQRIFWSGVACGLLSKSVWTFSRHSGRHALLLEQSGVASRQLFPQQRPPLRRQQRRSVLLGYQARLPRLHRQSVSG
jgi:hypothetical protein